MERSRAFRIRGALLSFLSARPNRVGLLGAALAVASFMPLSCSSADMQLHARWAESLAPTTSLSFAHWQQKSVHNAYEQGESVGELLGKHRFHSVEFDIHTGKLGRPSIDADWYVYHIDLPLFDGSSCRTLSSCLEQVASYHRQDPDHDVLTVFIDLKDAWTEGHTPAKLDERISSAFADDTLLRPADLMARCPGATGLRDAVTQRCTWPSLGELRGKVAVVLTGGDFCSEQRWLQQYDANGSATEQRLAFIGPDVNDKCPLSSYDNADQAVFFNLSHGALRHAASIARAGLVSRAYYGGMTGGLDEPDIWYDAVSAGVQFLVTDRIDAARFPWTERLRSVVGRPAAPVKLPSAPVVASAGPASFSSPLHDVELAPVEH